MVNIHVQTVLDDLPGAFGAVELVHVGLLGLQRLVHGEKVAHFLKGVPRQLVDVLVHVVIGVVGTSFISSTPMGLQRTSVSGSMGSLQISSTSSGSPSSQ